MNRDNLLIVGDSERNADLLYAVGVVVPEPFVYLRLKGRHLAAIGDWYARALRRHARHCRILPFSRFRSLAANPGKPVGLAQIIREILRQHRVKKIVVPFHFPHGLARPLRRLGVKLKVGPAPFFPSREFKTADEVKKISAAIIMAEVGLAEGLQALKAARVDKNQRLMYRHTPLTTERLRALIQTAMMQAGGVACHPVVCAGRQGSQPVVESRRVLRANEPILIRLFPRSLKTGYYGDLARTVVKGRASEKVRHMFQAVAHAQEAANAKALSGTPAAAVHQAALEVFQREGFPSTHRNGCSKGFCHDLGHGIGLEPEEPPFLNSESRDILCDGHVITLEPGLYYPEVGGVCLGDVLLINGHRPKNLVKFEKNLEI